MACLVSVCDVMWQLHRRLPPPQGLSMPNVKAEQQAATDVKYITCAEGCVQHEDMCARSAQTNCTSLSCPAIRGEVQIHCLTMRPKSPNGG